jgi:hypothetical protein
MTYYGDEAFPALSDEQWARLQACGSAQEVESGALLWGAGQGALYLAGRGNAVTLIVRGNDLAAGMSSYLADRILAHASITVRTAAKVTALHGGSHLEAITVYTAARATTNPTATSHAGACPALQRHHRHRLARGHRCR